MTNPPTYKFRNFHELFDRVPADRIEDCMSELAVFLHSVKRIEADVANLCPGHADKIRAELPEEFEWIDDGKRKMEITVSFKEE